MKVLRVIANHLLGLWINIRDKTVSLFVDYGKFPSNPDFPNIYIKNFGKMDDRFYRGAQPLNYNVYQQLYDLGVNTIINLRDNPDPKEAQYARSVGLRFVNIPIVGGSPPSLGQVGQFLTLLNNPETGTVFVHCKGGRHRTGAIGAVYRMDKYDWTYNMVYKEMKDFGFYSSWGFGDIKQFVKDYYNTYHNYGEPVD